MFITAISLSNSSWWAVDVDFALMLNAPVMSGHLALRSWPTFQSFTDWVLLRGFT
ncbi:hypothetical protein [Yoonia sp. R2-816]|uniref:hypothetical protein n=1 Tax=Yoonia sp. R2-816 TaxID=3342638 RepID=UPI00372D7F70